LSEKIKVIVADSNRLIRVGLDAVLSVEKEIQLIGEANNNKELREMVKSFLPDVVMIDYTSNFFSIDVVPECIAIYPKIRFVAITPDQSGLIIQKAIKAGINSYIKKDCDFNEIVDSVVETGRGGRFFCGQVLDIMRKEDIDLKDLEAEPLSCEPIVVSEREQEIIILIAEGYTNSQIANKLFLSGHTINTHRKNIMQKLGINNTAALVMYAVKTNLVSANKFLFSGQQV
jgi:DNA-binding NarL/FixJ family response regulator